jgi:DegV family protein with EDD domain
MTVAIVTDSGSDLTPAQIQESGIRQVPLSVSFGEQSFLSPDELSPEQFWEKMGNPDCPFPLTAAPSVGLFKQAFEKAFDEGNDGVVCVCLSSGISSTIGHAELAKEMLPGRDIFLVDSKSASLASGALALRGAALARAGLPAAEIASKLLAMRDATTLYVGLDTLDYLRKGGRISYAKAAIGGLLAIKPIITVVDGLVAVTDQPRTRSKAIERVIELVTERPVTELHVMYSPPADFEAFKAAVLARLPEPAPKVVTVQVIGPVVGVHIGPGASGAILVRESQ